jgi:flagellar hook-associated protein 1 FlgK
VAENTGGASVQSATVFDPTQLTLDDYQITFTANGPPATFDLVNTTTGSSVATGQSYSAGAAITFAGVDVRLTDTGTPPLAGDTFRISTTRNAARNLALNPTVAADAQKVAAAQSTLPGDNTNALALSAVGNTTLIDGTTLDGFYTALVTRIGAESQQQSSLAEQQQLVSSALSQRREAISGVSLEEEQIDLIRFQQAFGAAAELIKVADELADTVLGLVR